MSPRLIHGFSLVEVVLALGVAAFCLIAVMGLLSSGLGSNQSAIDQTEAASIARSIAGDLRATPATSGTAASISPQFGFSIPAPGQSVPQSYPNVLFFAEGLLPVGSSAASTAAVNATSDPLFRADVTLTSPNAGQRMATMARILVTWPALTNPNPSSPAQNYSGSYEVMTALDRN
jgi:uncharacterized protein (TIGR02598 family)